MSGIGTMRWAIAATAACLLVWPAASRADDEEGFARSGAYLTLAGTWAFENFDVQGKAGLDPSDFDFDIESDSSFDWSFDDSLGLNVRVGYRWLRHLAAEIHFEYLTDPGGTVKINGPDVSYPLDLDFHQFWTLTANVKVPILTGRFQPYVYAGGGILVVDADAGGVNYVDDQDITGRFGGGLDVYATEHFVVTLDASYVLPGGSVDDYDYVSLGWGLQYRF